MVASFGPRTYLVGCALTGLLANRAPCELDEPEIAKIAAKAIKIADMIENKMTWPDGSQ